jgi:hypothetical protein
MCVRPREMLQVEADGSKVKAQRIAAAASDGIDSPRESAAAPSAKEAKELKPDAVVTFEAWAAKKWEAYLRRQRRAAAAKRASLRLPGGGGGSAVRGRGRANGARHQDTFWTAGPDGSSYRKRLGSDMANADILD